MSISEKEKRNDQVLNICNKYNLSYDVKSNKMSKISKIWMLFSIGKYKRAFIGDIRNRAQLFYTLMNLSFGAKCICLDDGTDNIFLFKDGYRSLPSINHKLVFFIVRIACLMRKTTIGKVFFTIYDDIKNDYFIRFPNRFEYISKTIKNNRKESGCVYFIGTNNSVFCSQDNYPVDLVKRGLRNVLAEIKTKYPNQIIIYIPHGRDNAEFPTRICDDLGILIVRPKTTIELMLLETESIPVAIYGFTSTALYNIKLLFPQVEIYNIVFNVQKTNGFIKQMKVVSEYYREHGVNQIDFA